MLMLEPIGVSVGLQVQVLSYCAHISRKAQQPSCKNGKNYVKKPSYEGVTKASQFKVATANQN